MQNFYTLDGSATCGEINHWNHLKGSTGADSWRSAAASKHSAASSADAPFSLLYNKPRLYQAEEFVLSIRNASVRKLFTTGNDWPLSCRRTMAVETKLGTWFGSMSKAF